MYEGQKLVKEKAEIGTFSLFYPYNDDHERFDIDRYVQYKGNCRFDGWSSVNDSLAKAYKMIWAEHWKERM